MNIKGNKCKGKMKCKEAKKKKKKKKFRTYIFFFSEKKLRSIPDENHHDK
jgi:hypothetical protein